VVSVIMLSVSGLCHYSEFHYAECPIFIGMLSVIVLVGVMLSVAFNWYAECHSSECHYAKFCYAECCILLAY
jgi:hypothetical protein